MQTRDDQDRVLVEKIDKLSPDAYYLAGLYNFGIVMMGKPILMAINRNVEKTLIKRQEDAWDELLEAGFCHGDVERGVYGYRSTFEGQSACAMIRQHDNRADGPLG